MEQPKKPLLVCTFSGGRTSAFMAIFIKESPKYQDFDKIFLFANTGKERPETLEFINRCDKEWNLNVVWIEAKINPIKGKGGTFKVVDYVSASRNGEPFEAMLNAYPIPTAFGAHYTRELKTTPMEKYIKSLGYNNVVTAMGIRFDERHRISSKAERKKWIYPLIHDIQVDERFIRSWWERQSFDLELKDYEGNCDLCFKKSQRKKMTILKENPSIGDRWSRMEKEHATERVPRWDLRTNLSIDELVEMAQRPFATIQDKFLAQQQQTSLFDEIDDMSFDFYCKAD